MPSSSRINTTSPRLSSPTPYRSPGGPQLTLREKFARSKRLLAPAFVPLSVRRLNEGSSSSPVSFGSGSSSYIPVINVPAEQSDGSSTESDDSSTESDDSSTESEDESSNISSPLAVRQVAANEPVDISDFSFESSAVRTPSRKEVTGQAHNSSPGLSGSVRSTWTSSSRFSQLFGEKGITTDYLFASSKSTFILSSIGDQEVIIKLNRTTAEERAANPGVWYVETEAKKLESGGRIFKELVAGKTFIPTFNPEQEPNLRELWHALDGWAYDGGLTKKELAEVARQCFQCKHYMSTDSKGRHACPCSQKRNKQEAKADNSSDSMSDRFQNMNGPGLTPDEFEYFIVRCTGCKKFITRSAAWRHHHTVGAETHRLKKMAKLNRRRSQ